MLAQFIKMVMLATALNKDTSMKLAGVLLYHKTRHRGHHNEYDSLLALDHQPSENPFGA